MNFLYDSKKICSRAVHLVDVRNLRHAVLVGLAPDRFGLGLDATYCAEGCDGAVEHAERTLHFDGKVNVAGSINQVDLVTVLAIVPEGGGGSRGDGNTTFLLLHHPVHRSGTVMHLPDLMGLTRIIEDALRRRRLAGVDVGHDTNVPGECKISRHCLTR